MRLLRLFKSEIKKEAAEWVADNVVSEQQAEAICARYGIDYRYSDDRSLGYSVLMGLGYLFIGLAVITLLGANWDEIPRALRMWGLISLTMATQGFAVKRYLSGDTQSGVGLFLLGNLFYGASIILIAQIYHLGEHMPDGVFWWALGCLPIALLTRNTWLTLMTMLLALIWFFLETSLGFYPLLFPLFIIAAIVVLINAPPSLLLFIVTVASIGFWVEFSLSALWREDRQFEFFAEHLAVSVALFIFAYAVSHWLVARGGSLSLGTKATSNASFTSSTTSASTTSYTSIAASGKSQDYAVTLALWTLRFGLLFLLVMSFRGPWESLIETTWSHLSSMSVIVSLLLAAALVLGGARRPQLLLIIAVYVGTLAWVIFSNNPDSAFYLQVLYNLLLLLCGISLLVQGIQRGITHYFFLGVATLLVTAFLRYVDLIGDYIGGAILFMVFAVVLLGAARYWKTHTTEGES